MSSQATQSIEFKMPFSGTVGSTPFFCVLPHRFLRMSLQDAPEYVGRAARYFLIFRIVQNKILHICIIMLVLFAHRSDALYDPIHHIESARLYGNIDHYAYWFLDLLVGTPPQRASVILDTGSGTCAFPCASCRHCGKHIDSNFNFAKSKTAKWVPCGATCSGRCTKGHCSYQQGYQEGSAISGFYFEDWVRLGDSIQRNPAVFTKMGCHQDENKLFFTQKANGIMGIRGPGTFLQALFQDRSHIESRVFAMCLAEWGGRLVVGGYNQSYHTGTIVWMPLSLSLFSVTLSSMVVSGTRGRAIRSFGHTIVDSGTTYTYMGAGPYNALRGNIEAYCRSHKSCGAIQAGTCWTIRDGPVGLSRFPTIEVYFGAQKTFWESRSYLYRKGTSNRWCYAFENDGPGANTVLGASWFLHHEVIFDLRSNKIGVVQANCPEYRQRPPHSIVNVGLANTTSRPSVVAISTTKIVSKTRRTGTTSRQNFSNVSLVTFAPSKAIALVRGIKLQRSGLLALIVIPSVVGLCLVVYCGWRLLRREDQNPHTKLEQFDDSGMPPQIVGEPGTASNSNIGDDSDDGFQLVHNVDSGQGNIGLDQLGTPEHALDEHQAEWPSPQEEHSLPSGGGPLE